jgi:hypothetical protein
MRKQFYTGVLRNPRQIDGHDGATGGSCRPRNDEIVHTTRSARLANSAEKLGMHAATLTS